MKRRWGYLVAMFVSTPFLLGMGLLGEPPPREKTPETKERMQAVVVDLEGVSTDVDYFSYDGDLYLPAYRGRALVIIPFEKILAVELGETNQGRRQATVTFRNQEQEILGVDERLLFLGRVPYGTLQVQAKDLQRILLVEKSAD